MPQPWVKVCGMTRERDIAAALSLGARYVGCIVEIARSPRCVTADRASALGRAAGGRMVFVVQDRDPGELSALCTQAGVAAVQLHGDEAPAYTSELKHLAPDLIIWKVLGVPPAGGNAQSPVEALLDRARAYLAAGCDGILLDAQVKGVSGGTGRTCDWNTARRVVESLAGDVILAGGIGPDNVLEAAHQVAPAGLDLSSGVEEAPGVKSVEEMQRLFRALAGD